MRDAISQTERTAWFATVSARVAMARRSARRTATLTLRGARFAAGVAALGVVGCASGPGPAKEPGPDAQRAEGEEPSAAAPDSGAPGTTPGAGSVPGAPAPGTTAPGAAAPGAPGATSGPLAQRPAPVDGRAADPARGLPEVSVRHIGLHVGGGPNDEATRRPILRALEQHTQQFLWCYRQVDRPLRGGVYGVDLYVPPAGGRPEVRSTRQKLGPAEFDQCMSEAFRGVNLPRPPRATVVSYSLRFDVVDPTAQR